MGSMRLLDIFLLSLSAQLQPGMFGDGEEINVEVCKKEVG